jgi:hypothetical protein
MVDPSIYINWHTFYNYNHPVYYPRVVYKCWLAVHSVNICKNPAVLLFVFLVDFVNDPLQSIEKDSELDKRQNKRTAFE